MRPWNTVVRAAFSLLVLLGFYALITGCFVLVAFGGGLLLGAIDNVALFLLAGLTLGLLLGACVAALLQLKAKPFVPKGIPLLRDDAPGLWGTLTELADTVGTRLPDQVWIIAVPNAAVVERRRLLGLLPGRRILLVGFPLLQGLSYQQMRAVLAHEFGHYGRLDGRLTALGYQGHVAVARMLERFPRSTLNPLSWLFLGYARMFILTQRLASRRQEYHADKVMGRIAGRAAAQSALRALPLLGDDWDRYLHAYVNAGLVVGLAPDNIFGGFAEMLDARREWFVTADVPFRPLSHWDTHPPTLDRLWALEATPEVSDVDDRTALAMVADAALLATRLEVAVFDFGDRRRVPWDTYPLETALALLRESADKAYRSIARSAGQEQGSLELLLALCAGGDEQAVAVIEDEVVSAVLLAAYEAGSLRYTHRWDEVSEFQRQDGSTVDGYELVDDLIEATPEGADRARATLTGLGIDLAAAAGSSRRLSPRGSTIMGALAHVKIDDRLGYLFVTDLGLLFVHCTAKSNDNGKVALLQLMENPPAALAARGGSLWLPYEEFARVEKHRNVPIKATLTLHGGAVHKIAAVYSGYSHRDSHTTILDVMTRHAY
ncbi:M48 family metallopeptidase [Amycolatopsis sp.]|jgi:Zn-dependent protease with chaperone function|uniref:M48 family metallopeptidase n=1 Tax=Amycolatopsis sp. TaxID=37632 RepID=UPI002DFB190A|nr:M48 family metallopeptidase [Amycolatopsis sp.]